MTPAGRRPLGPSVRRGPQLTLTLDGEPVGAHLGETVATVLMAEHRLAIRTTTRGAPRGVFCGMGTCFDCLVVVDGVPNTRACMTWVRDGMEVSRQHGLGPA
jgi:predicted molibdopterin-dependent oxidoreductase YjgC